MSKRFYRVVFSPEIGTELEKFAAWFHQDCDLMFSSFDEGARAYVDGLTPQEKSSLKQQMTDFADTHAKKTRAAARKQWAKLGADYWDKNLPLMKTLREFADQL